MQPAPSDAPASEQQIQQCLRMLEGKTDEHKFAGLLMLTKLAPGDDVEMRRVRKQVVETVGGGFFLRLITTRGDSEDGLSSFQTLGLNLIASFCGDPEIANTFAVEKVVRLVLEQLALAASPPSQAALDCVQILQGIALCEAGVNLLSQDSLEGRLVSALKAVVRAAPSKEKEAQPDKDDKSMDEIVGGLWRVLQTLSRSQQFWVHLASYDFEFLCSTFSTATGAVAIQILSVLNSLLELAEEGSAPAELLSSRALSDIRVGVARFLRAKWKGHERDECLRLVHQLMRQFDISWTLPGTTLRSQETQDDVSGGKFVVLVLKLVGIEIKLMLDEVELALIQMEETTIERVEEEARQQQEVQRTMGILPICYGIVESAIAGIVSSDDGAFVLPYDILLQLKQSFADTFTVVLEHLTAVRDFMKTHRYKDLATRHSPTVSQLDAVAFASVRVTSAWLAEDSDTCAKQVIDLLPFLVCYKPLDPVHDGVHTSNQSMSDPDSDDELDSDDEVDAMGEMLRTATKIHESDSQIDQLHFLLPGLLQISAMPEGAQVIAENVEVLQRIFHFCCTLCANISTGDEQFGSIPTLTLSLGVLTNLLLLRSSNVQVTSSGRAASPLPNAIEWYRALSFLLPMACATGSHLMKETSLMEEERGEDDRYVMVLHVICVILLIASNFVDKKTRPIKLSPAVLKLVDPFNAVTNWIMAHPPDASSESATDLLELSRGLLLRSPLRQSLS